VYVAIVALNVAYFKYLSDEYLTALPCVSLQYGNCRYGQKCQWLAKTIHNKVLCVDGKESLVTN